MLRAGGRPALLLQGRERPGDRTAFPRAANQFRDGRGDLRGLAERQADLIGGVLGGVQGDLRRGLREVHAVGVGTVPLAVVPLRRRGIQDAPLGVVVVAVSRAGVAAGWEDGSADHATTSTLDVWQRRLLDGENIREGIKAFVEKRAPKWVPSKL